MLVSVNKKTPTFKNSICTSDISLEFNKTNFMLQLLVIFL